MADHVVDAKGRPTRAVIEHAMFDLQPGVTVLSVSPAIDAPEIRGLDPDWSGRVEDYLVTSHDAGIRNLVERSGATLIGYRELRDGSSAAGVRLPRLIVPGQVAEVSVVGEAVGSVSRR